MNKYRAYWPLDDAPQPFGDGSFTGVNALLDPAILQPGEVASAVNCRFDEGRAATRKGIRIMSWGAPGYQAVNPSLVLPYPSPILAESYADPYGQEWLVIVTAGAVYKAQTGSRGSVMPMPVGTHLEEAVDLIQTYNGMVMLRGADHDPIYMKDVDEGWLALPSPDAGKEAIPPSLQGLYFQNRLFTVDARTGSQYVDTIWVSDAGGVGSTLQGDSVYQSYKINAGSSDRLRGIAKFNETTLICGKERSIYALSNIVGTNQDIAENAVLSEVTRQYGCIAPRSFVQVGKDLWFLGHKRGVCSIVQTETNALQGVDVPVSRPIQPLIDRINWEHASNARAAAHDNRVYFAVPLDDSTTNNAILVYSTLTQKWAGYDYSSSTRVLDFVKFTYAGAVRQGFVSEDGFICLYEDGYYDQAGDNTGVVTNNPIVTTVTTRGYAGEASGHKRCFRASARLASWNGQYTVRALPNGYNEGKTVKSVTKSNTRYMRPYGAAAWDATNDNDDWDTPWREDYSSVMGGVQVTDSDGDGTMAFDVLQETEEIWPIPGVSAGHVQLEFASSRGRLEVIGAKLDSRRGRTAENKHA